MMNGAEFTLDFGYGEKYPHSMFLPDEVHLSRNEPGLYAWYLRAPRSAADEAGLAPYRNIHVKRRFKVTATAPLGEQMDGEMERMPKQLKEARMGEGLDMAFFASAFAPPIYIGRSKRVRTRLTTHMRALDDELARGVGNIGDVEPISADSDEESSQFGVRVARLLKEHSVNHYNGLFVKVVYAPSNLATKRAELVLNRTIHPALGRL